HGLEWTHTLSKKSFYNLGVRQNYFNYDDMAYPDLYDARYDSAGAPTGIPEIIDQPYYKGGSLNRFHQNTNALIFKGSYVSQITNDHQVKMGGEFQFPRLEFGNLGYLIPVQTPSGAYVLRRVESDPAHQLMPLAVYHPVQGAAYAQEQTEWNDLN